jgi:hypothetical protein
MKHKIITLVKNKYNILYLLIFIAAAVASSYRYDLVSTIIGFGVLIFMCGIFVLLIKLINK